MGQRSRKRRRTEDPAPVATAKATGPAAGAATPAAADAPPSAKAAPPEAGAATPGAADAPPSAQAPPSEAAPDRMKRGYARGRERDERIRAALEPIKPGERPAALTVAALVALALGLANVGLMVGGVDVNGEEPAAFGVILFAALMFAAAYGLWRTKYWAVLGFEALLAFTIVIAALSLTTASNLAAVALCVGIVLFGGWLFWKLIRVMARIQMPNR